LDFDVDVAIVHLTIAIHGDALVLLRDQEISALHPPVVLHGLPEELVVVFFKELADFHLKYLISKERYVWYFHPMRKTPTPRKAVPSLWLAFMMVKNGKTYAQAGRTLGVSAERVARFCKANNVSSKSARRAS
jgi:hypothetical protein